MKIKTTSTWDQELWEDAGPIYAEAFGEKGAKPVKIIQNMLTKGIAELYIGYNESKAIAMALVGKLNQEQIMIIDYLAVSEKERNQGIGRQFVEYLKQKAGADGIKTFIIEAESAETADNRKRIEFWQSCGFLTTDYIHTYIWVPEKYKALYIPLAGMQQITGEELFTYINKFHRLSFLEKKNDGAD